jgi:mono/diheme cytochrome c family protein
MRALWKAWTPVRRTFAALAAFLSLLLLIACGLIVNELYATDLIAAKSTNTLANGENKVKNEVEKEINKDALERGAYLAKVGNCAACHTARGGAAYAGGKGISTPFGTVYSSNITPDTATGIGQWSADAFYRALHEGRSADGHLLTPAFPYPNYTHVSRADSDDLYAFFMHSVTPVAQPNRAHELPFPYNTQVALAFWRTLFFEKADVVASISPKNTINNIAAQAVNTNTKGLPTSR